MASHDVALKVTTELPVGGSDLEIPVKRNGRRIGVFTVNSNGVSWNPSTSKAATSVSWEDLPDALSGKPAAAPAAPAAAAAPAKKAAAKKTSTPAKKAAAKKTAPAETPAAPEPTVEEAPAPTPAPAAPAAKKTAKKAAKKSTPAPAASSTTTSAVDARAVRAWAAENGIAVAPRGPISSSIIDQFRAAS